VHSIVPSNTEAEHRLIGTRSREANQRVLATGIANCGLIGAREHASVGEALDRDIGAKLVDVLARDHIGRALAHCESESEKGGD